MKYLIDHWAQASVLIALLTGCIGYLLKLFFINRDKRRHTRNKIFEQEKLKAYVFFNNSFIEMSSKIVTWIDIYDISRLQNEINKLNELPNDFFIKTITLSSYLNSKNYKNYELLYGKFIDILMDITMFNSCIIKAQLSRNRINMQ